jgi:hypothetical protein
MSVENHDEVAKTISYLSSTLNEGLDYLVEPLNLIDKENLLFEIDSNNDSKDLHLFDLLLLFLFLL